MGFLVDGLLLGGTTYLAAKIAEMATGELYDPGRIRDDLLALQWRLESGEIDEATYAEAEGRLLDRLDEIEEMRRAEEGAAQTQARPSRLTTKRTGSAMSRRALGIKG